MNLTDLYLKPTNAASAGINFAKPDLAKHPPRSPRARLGGYVHLPRLIDKARAAAAGTSGDYHYPCPFDQRFLAFTGLDATAFQSFIAQTPSDSAILDYVSANSRPGRTPEEIAQWSASMEQWRPEDPEAVAFFKEVLTKNAPHRQDIVTWFEWLELDDWVSFGGEG